MNTVTLLTYLITCVVSAATPGPGTMSVIAYSAFLGWRKTLPVIFGIQVGMLAMALLAFSGVTAALSASPLLFNLLQYIGALYIAYLGVLSLKYARKGIGTDGAAYDKGAFRNFNHGALVTFASPKTLLFFTSIFPIFLDASRSVLPQMVFLLTLLLGCTFFVHIIYAFCMKYFSRLLKEHSVIFNITVGIIFLGLALYMALQVELYVI
ncbi:Leucine efflux protein [Photorhabdus australis subsp. thailandensis]|uniref:Leucine efflux protein n=1 Tax=Photorhabdus australis subsp. thailandensis TaxID=2805096 RepID=A0A1C0U3B1_9GAMM|nr:LysE family translocator [Photorhabdus australis]OCQ52375.1 Leucine efflux protein [Photorhabdus australis subsp. thailandensis]